jgi:hypothetical protein
MMMLDEKLQNRTVFLSLAEETLPEEHRASVISHLVLAHQIVTVAAS